MNTFKYSSREDVMFFDTDIGGVVHNLAYLRMIETNRTKLAELMGMNLKSMMDDGVFPVVLRTGSGSLRARHTVSSVLFLP